MTETAENQTLSFQKLKTRKFSAKGCNDVLMVKHDDETLSATFLGATLFKKISVPIDPKFVEKIVDTLFDKDELASFCVRRGINEAMANDAIKEGAGARFEEELSTYSPDYVLFAVRKILNKSVEEAPKQTKKRTKKDEAIQSPAKKIKKTKKSAAAETEAPKENGAKDSHENNGAVDDDNDVDDKTKDGESADEKKN